jgi:hypothetical protein
LADALGKLLETMDDHTQVLVPSLSLRHYFSLGIQLAQALLGTAQARFKLRLVEQAFGVGVDQTCQAALHSLSSRLLWFVLRRQRGGLFLDAAGILGLDAARVGQQRADILPNGRLKRRQRHRGQMTHTLTIAATTIVADAAIVAIAAAARSASALGGLTVTRVAALLTDDEPLEEVAGAAVAGAVALAIVTQLVGGSVEQLRGDQGRHGDSNPFFAGSRITDASSSWHFRPAALRTQPGPTLTDARLAIGGLAAVSGVTQQSADSGGLPQATAATCQNPLFFQAATQFAEGTTVLRHPRKQALDDGCFVGRDLVAGRRRGRLGDVTIAVRRGAEDADGAALGGVTLAAATAFLNLGAFVLGDDALHLHEQFILGTGADSAIEKDHVDVAALQLIQQQRLMRLPSRQAIGRQHIKTVKQSACGGIAQAFQRGPQQRAARTAVIDEAQSLAQGIPILSDTFAQHGNLAGDGVVARLTIRGDAGIDGNGLRRRSHDLFSGHGDAPRSGRRPLLRTRAVRRGHRMLQLGYEKLERAADEIELETRRLRVAREPQRDREAARRALHGQVLLSEDPLRRGSPRSGRTDPGCQHPRTLKPPQQPPGDYRVRN